MDPSRSRSPASYTGMPIDVDHEIGEGAQSNVFEAVWNGRHGALTVLKENSDSPSARRMKRVADLVLDKDIRHMPRVHGFGDFDNGDGATVSKIHSLFAAYRRRRGSVIAFHEDFFSILFRTHRIN